MAVVEGLVAIVIVLAVCFLLWRHSKRRELRDRRAFQLQILTEAKELVKLLMVDRELAKDVHSELGQALGEDDGPEVARESHNPFASRRR